MLVPPDLSLYMPLVNTTKSPVSRMLSKTPSLSVAGPKVAKILVPLGKIYSAALSSNIATAGSFLPSKNSKNAPPPVEI